MAGSDWRSCSAPAATAPESALPLPRPAPAVPPSVRTQVGLSLLWGVCSGRGGPGTALPVLQRHSDTWNGDGGSPCGDADGCGGGNVGARRLPVRHRFEEQRACTHRPCPRVPPVPRRCPRVLPPSRLGSSVRLLGVLCPWLPALGGSQALLKQSQSAVLAWG